MIWWALSTSRSNAASATAGGGSDALPGWGEDGQQRAGCRRRPAPRSRRRAHRLAVERSSSSCLSSRAAGLAARLRGAALQPRAAARLSRRDDRAAVPSRIVALPRTPGRARRLEVEVQALVDQRLALAVAGKPRHAVARARVDHAAVVEAVDQPDAAVRRTGIARRAGRIASLEDVLD